ncbi:DNA methyltransferase [Bradyrhizobium symbiodeficiens]|uniref:DNA methyltransferase n=1 Tax=Bradyrhizobium symbiodeficiens TaxID=1404367 RepID=UPI0030CEF0EC
MTASYIRNTVAHGDCVKVMSRMESASVDFILTDPPYLCRYRPRDGQTIANDDCDSWLAPAFAEMHRVLKPGSLCLSFYGWNAADKFIGAWRAAGFRMVGHIVFTKRYASSSRFLQSKHEQAYLLAKGEPARPLKPIDDVRDWQYTGNRLHPTQKPTKVLEPLVEAFCPIDGIVLDPFCGSGSTLIAAHRVGRSAIGIELDAKHVETATLRLASADFAGARTG